MKTFRPAATFFIALMLSTTGSALATEDRAVPLEGVKNTRDLGGLQTEDGRMVRKGLLIRSGEIDHISAAGMTRLDDMGVTSIVDLRTTKEANADPAQWPEGQGPVRFNFPLLEQETATIDHMREIIANGTATVAETDELFKSAFTDIAADYPTELRALFDVLRDQPEGEAVLYHCSGGKDRTGVATALVLSALGVTREDIEADFMMSNTLVDADNAAIEVAARVNEQQGTQMTPEDVWPSLGVRMAYLDAFYDSITERYGSVDAFLHDELGITDADIEALRARYLE